MTVEVRDGSLLAGPWCVGSGRRAWRRPIRARRSVPAQCATVGAALVGPAGGVAALRFLLSGLFVAGPALERCAEACRPPLLGEHPATLTPGRLVLVLTVDRPTGATQSLASSRSRPTIARWTIRRRP
jgi:hypothetical protein